MNDGLGVARYVDHDPSLEKDKCDQSCYFGSHENGRQMGRAVARQFVASPPVSSYSRDVRVFEVLQRHPTNVEKKKTRRVFREIGLTLP